MFKTIFALFILATLSFALSADQNQSKKQEFQWNKSKSTFVSEKEARYQEYKKKLDKENQKLEEDGFCSCNNN